MTDVEICNLALARLGDAKITSLSDLTAQAKYCNLFYAQTVKELQADFNWQFCRKQSAITADVVPPTFGYTGRYALPIDFLRVLRINGVSDTENFGKWEIIGTFLHTDLTGPIQLDYLANITTTTEFPSIFIEVLSAKLAAQLAMPLTGSKELFAQLATVFSELAQRPSVAALTSEQAKNRASAPITNDEICRQAILRIGTADQVGPSTQGMLLAQSMLPQVRDSLLLAGSWTWANKTVSLTSDTIAPEYRFEARYLLPSDCLRVFRVGDSGIENDWEVQGQYLLTDVDSDAPAWAVGRVYAVGNAVTSGALTYRCAIAHTAGADFATDLAASRWAAWTGSVCCVEYISKVTDPTQFDSGFIELLMATLAAKLAVPVGGDPNKAKLLMVEAEQLLKTSAMRRDSTERRVHRKPAWENSRLISSRYA